MTDLCEFQIIDPDNNLVMPWLTHPALDEIKIWDLSDKVIWQFGAGRGDAWLAKRCKKLYCVERNEEWVNISSSYAQANNIFNIEYLYRPCDDCTGKADYYTELIPGIDIIINDDAYRTEVCQVAVDYFRNNNNGILICDNWKQSYVWISPKAEEILAPFACQIFEQADHKDNDGVNKWKTLIAYMQYYV